MNKLMVESGVSGAVNGWHDSSLLTYLNGLPSTFCRKRFPLVPGHCPSREIGARARLRDLPLRGLVF